MPIARRFRLAYQGESEYDVGDDRVAVRYRAFPGIGYSDDVYAREILPRLGTVYFVSKWDQAASKIDQFPPPEIVALFPGYVASRYNSETGQIEHESPPDVTEDFLGPVARVSAVILTGSLQDRER